MKRGLYKNLVLWSLALATILIVVSMLKPRSGPEVADIQALNEFPDSGPLVEADTAFAYSFELFGQGRLDEAAKLQARSIEIARKALGPDDPKVANAEAYLGYLYLNLGHNEEALRLFERSVAVLEKSPNAVGNVNVGFPLMGIADFYLAQGEREAAEEYYRRALSEKEDALGREHPEIATVLTGLAHTYEEMGRYAEAELLLKRAIGLGGPFLSGNRLQLAGVLRKQGRQEESTAVITPLLEGDQTIPGAGILSNLRAPGPLIAFGLKTWSEQMDQIARDGEELVSSLLDRIEKFETIWGPDSEFVASGLRNLAIVYWQMEESKKAKEALLRSIAIREAKHGLPDPKLAIDLYLLAMTYLMEDSHKDALRIAKRSLAAFLGPPVAESSRKFYGDRSERVQSEYFFSRIYLFYLTVAHIQQRNWIRTPEDLSQKANVMADAFRALQSAKPNTVNQSINYFSARFVGHRGALSGKIRELQDALRHRKQLDRILITELSSAPDQRSPEREKELRGELAVLRQKIQAIGSEISVDYPEYAALAHPKPLDLKETQELLAQDEALMVYATVFDLMSVWVIRADQAKMLILGKASGQPETAVSELRSGLDLSRMNDAKSLPEFSVETAHELYEEIFAPAEAFLTGVNHVLVVPDGALESLPLGVLITRAAENARCGSSGCDQIEWLADRYAFSVLPSVASLAALRKLGSNQKPSKPFVGFGAPVLKGKVSRSGDALELLTSSLFRGGRTLADPEDIRTVFSELPETKAEIEAMAKFLKAGKEAVFLGERATETNVKQTDLSDIRVLAFATHASVAGDFSEVGEPALVLTPPKNATEVDDGLLRASEVAELDLNADWVILSACNTAGPDGTPGASGLSGLASAFFYAGSRSLLVSQWPVASEPTVTLTTRMMQEVSEEGVGRAEALKRSMRALRKTPGRPEYAHPFFWAPFMVVGEGGRPDQVSTNSPADR